jgi:hypothetical protein
MARTAARYRPAAMLRVAVSAPGAARVLLESGQTLRVGRAPGGSGGRALRLSECAPHVSRVLGEIVVGRELVRLRWYGSVEAQLSSLFDAPGGARRAILSAGMGALLDEGENHLRVLRGRAIGDGYADLLLILDVSDVDRGHTGLLIEPDPDAAPTGPAPGLSRVEREWYVALALAEPWLTGTDDYPRPPSNREIYERVLAWRGHAWNLGAPQRVDDAIRAIAMIAFGRHADPFRAARVGRTQNLRYSVGRRIAEVRLVTAADLAAVERDAAARRAAGADPAPLLHLAVPITAAAPGRR